LSLIENTDDSKCELWWPYGKEYAENIAGVIFLGTPHRGSASSNWGRLIVQSGKFLKLDGEDRIVNDLKRIRKF